MKKTIRLTESDLTRIVKKVIKEQRQTNPTPEQEKKFKVASDKCLASNPLIAEYMKMDNMPGMIGNVLWMTVAPDFMLTDKQKEIKRQYESYKKCMENIVNNISKM